MTNSQAALIAAATYCAHSEDPSYALETAAAWAVWLDRLDRERSAAEARRAANRANRAEARRYVPAGLTAAEVTR